MDHSLHAACSQTHGSTPFACVAQKMPSVIPGLPHLGLDSQKLALHTHDGEQQPNGSHASRRLRSEDGPIVQVKPFASFLDEPDELNQGLNSVIWLLVQRPWRYRIVLHPVTARNALSSGQTRAGSTAFARQMSAHVSRSFSCSSTVLPCAVWHPRLVPVGQANRFNFHDLCNPSWLCCNGSQPDSNQFGCAPSPGSKSSNRPMRLCLLIRAFLRQDCISELLRGNLSHQGLLQAFHINCWPWDLPQKSSAFSRVI